MSLNWLLVLPYFASLATWLFPRLALRPHSAAEAESLPRAPFSLAALACLMGLSLALSLFPAALARPEFGLEAYGPAGTAVDYWWTQHLYQFRFRADALALTAVAILYLAGFLLSLYSYSLPTPALPHRRATYLLAAVGSASVALLSVDLVATLFFFSLFLLALWLFARADSPREADRMLLLTSLGAALLTAAAVLLWQEGGITATAGLSLALVGSDPRVLHALGLLALLGFLPLLAAFPVYWWLPRLARENLRGAMACGVLLLAGGLALALRLLPGSVSLPLLPGFSSACVPLGVITLLWGSAGAWGSRSVRSLALWLTMAQSGQFLLALGAAGTSLPGAPLLGLQAAFLSLVAAPFALLALWSVAGVTLARMGTDAHPGLGGLLGRLPVAAFAFLLGGLSLVGLPPLPGFWAQRLLFQAQPLALRLVLLLADLLVLLAIAGGFRRVFLRAAPSPLLLPARRWMETQLVLVVLLLLALTVALAGGPARDWTETIVRGVLLPGP